MFRIKNVIGRMACALTGKHLKARRGTGTKGGGTITTSCPRCGRTVTRKIKVKTTVTE